MVQPAMADPVALDEAARAKLLPALAGVKPGQLDDGTPCTEWNVQQLMVHNIKVAEFFFRVITGDGRADRLSTFEVDGPLPAEGIEAAFEAITNRIIEAARAPGLWRRSSTQDWGRRREGFPASSEAFRIMA